MNPEDQFNRAIAKRARETREAAGLSQKDVGKRLGLSEVGYGHYERGTHPFTTWQLFQLARILGRPVEYFLGLDTGLSADEGELLARYRGVEGAAARAMILRLVRSMVQGD